MPGSSRSRAMAVALPNSCASWCVVVASHAALGTRAHGADGRREHGGILLGRAPIPASTGRRWARSRSPAPRPRWRSSADSWRHPGMITAAERAGGGSVYEHGWGAQAGLDLARTVRQCAGRRRRTSGACHLARGAGILPLGRRCAARRPPMDCCCLRRTARPADRTLRDGSQLPVSERRVRHWRAMSRRLRAGGPRTGRASWGAALRGETGHARAGSTPAGVNGLHEMGGNVWEWVDAPPDARGTAPRLTRGGSWWYGAAQMRRDHVQGQACGHVGRVHRIPLRARTLGAARRRSGRRGRRSSRRLPPPLRLTAACAAGTCGSRPSPVRGVG
jgi:hypothetical protein